ncbi:MAG: UDP-N-acetylmuramoyl-L-alanyl-D-glutamate--2,6-diaminopimelate ligase [Nannocystaceae bacterium]|nr:UDP-N-acetylmuramoyl-L-alanyl-D-glutamate--2,6-diaminopimelate ligase [bacterium]
MKLEELFAGLPVNPSDFVGCDPQTEVEGLCVDSRTVATTPGCAFLATAGETVDAHRFVPNAVRDGARVVIVQRGSIDAPGGPHVWMDDTATAHPQLAANAMGRPASSLQLAGVTGTNGKTTTAHLLGSILEHHGAGFSRLGTTGNWVVDREESATFTTPFPLELQGLLRRTVDRGGRHVVMEASSHALAQGRVEPLRFHAIGFTSFSQDHLDFHPTMEAYLAAKCRLASHYLAAGGVAVAAVDDQPAGITFLNQASEARARLRVSRGAEPDAEILASDIEYGPRHTRARVRTPEGTFGLQTPLIAPYNLDNALVALGMGWGLGVSYQEGIAALANARGAPGRLERIHVDAVTGPTVVVDYAHTPDAVVRALAAVRPLCNGRVHVLLGCGGDRDPTKRPLMGHAAASGADVFWATSDNPRTERPDAIVDAMLSGVPDGAAEVHRVVLREDAIARAVAQAADDDLVLIAGKGHEDYQVLGTEKIHFDDREHAQAALKRRSPSA